MHMHGRGDRVKASSADVTRTRGQTASSPHFNSVDVDDPSTTSSESAIAACRNVNASWMQTLLFIQSSFFFLEGLFYFIF